MPDDMSMMGGPPPMPPDGAQAAGQLAQKPGGQGNGSLLNLILTFLAGAGLKEVMGSVKQMMPKQSKGQGAGKPGAAPPAAAMPPQGAQGAPPGGQPSPQGGPGGMSPQMLQQLLAMLAAKGQGQPQNPQGM